MEEKAFKRLIYCEILLNLVVSLSMLLNFSVLNTEPEVVCNQLARRKLSVSDWF